mmetsp:Transcript_8114/g.29937  ORF Transcript_8114/g.29937 Transcript_8114/m.29937 type:complete len:456 (+) Transcript_8114:128-1495(+)
MFPPRLGLAQTVCPTRAQLVIRCYLLSYWAGVAAYQPFLPVYLRAAGVGTIRIGAILSVSRLALVLSKPTLAAMADAFGCHRPVLFCSIVFSALFRCVLYLMAPNFAALLTVAVISEVVGGPAQDIADSSIMAMVQAQGRPASEYGQERLWGAIGYGWISAPLSGTLISVFGFKVAFINHLVLEMCAGFVSLNFTFESLAKDEHSMVEIAGTLCRRLGQPHIAVCLLLFYVFGASMGVVDGYLLVFLSDMGASSILSGWALSVTCVVEVAVFMVATQLMTYLKMSNCLHTILVCYILRLTWYSLLPQMPSLWWVLPIQSLHGFTFGLMWATLTTFARGVAPEGMSTTVLSVFSSVFGGAGVVSGQVFGGVTYQKYGGVFLFRLTATILFVSNVGLLLLPKRYREQMNRDLAGMCVGNSDKGVENDPMHHTGGEAQSSTLYSSDLQRITKLSMDEC